MPTVASTFIFANEAGELRAHPAGYALLRYTAGAARLAPFRELITQMARLLVQRRWYRLLSDARQLPLLPPDCKAWMVEHWVKGATARPAQVVVAVVQPEQVLARLSTYEMQAQAQGAIRYTHFADEAAAHAFLAAQQGLAARPARRPPPKAV